MKKTPMATRYSKQAVLAFVITTLSVSTSAAGQDTTASESAPSPHVVRTTKFTINDVDKNTAFYEKMLGMTEMNRFAPGGGESFVEPFMGFGDADRRVGLLWFKEQETVEKSPYPVTVISVADFDGLVTRFEKAQYALTLLPTSDTGGIRIAIARDPSGNAIELIEADGTSAVAGSRLIVDDRQKEEEFFVRIFGETGVAPGQRFQTEAFDEVLMDFGGEMFVALFEPKGVAPLPKSEQPVVAIYSTEFDAVLQRVKDEGLGLREFGEGMFLATAPSGNVVEVVRQRD